MILVHILATLVGSFAATVAALVGGHGLALALAAYLGGGVAGLGASVAIMLLIGLLPLRPDAEPQRVTRSSEHQGG